MRAVLQQSHQSQAWVSASEVRWEAQLPGVTATPAGTVLRTAIPAAAGSAPLPFFRAISAAVLPSQSAVSSAAAPPASSSERRRAGEPLRAAANGGEDGRASDLGSHCGRF